MRIFLFPGGRGGALGHHIACVARACSAMPDVKSLASIKHSSAMTQSIINDTTSGPAHLTSILLCFTCSKLVRKCGAEA